MLEGFCEYLRRQGKSENTVKAYCQGMKEYMRWHEETFGKRMKLFLRATRIFYDEYGQSYRGVDAELKQRIQDKLTARIMERFRPD